MVFTSNNVFGNVAPELLRNPDVGDIPHWDMMKALEMVVPDGTVFVIFDAEVGLGIDAVYIKRENEGFVVQQPESSKIKDAYDEAFPNYS